MLQSLDGVVDFQVKGSFDPFTVGYFIISYMLFHAIFRNGFPLFFSSIFVPLYTFSLDFSMMGFHFWILFSFLVVNIFVY